MTKREYLKKKKGGKTLINMETVYRQLDQGRKVKDVAAEWGVSESTLYRRHREYQAYVDAVLAKESLPPLPDEILGEDGGL